MKKKKVGIFGGSFDPVHFGHLNLAISLKEAAGLDLVLFVPAKQSPFKQERAPYVSAEHRLEMVQRAISGITGFDVLDYELKRPSPSYTIDTVRQLASDNSIQWHLLLAEDHILTFPSWKESDLLIRLAPPLIGVRGNQNLSCPWGKLIQTPYFEISSTLIRDRLMQKKYCGHLVPQTVLGYIQENTLYTGNDD